MTTNQQIKTPMGQAQPTSLHKAVLTTNQTKNPKHTNELTNNKPKEQSH